MKSLALLALLSIAQAEDPVQTMEAAVTAYRAEQFREAGDLFVEVYEATKAPAQLRNAAKAYQDGDLFDAAILTWRRYRAIDGLEASAVAEAEAQLRFIEERRAAESAREQAEAAEAKAEAAERDRQAAEAARAAAERKMNSAPPPPAIVATPPPPAPPYGAYLTAGAGAVAMFVAGGLYLHANGRLGTLDEQLGTTNASGRIVGIHRDAAAAELDGINGERNAAAAAVSVGAVAVAVGVVWWALAD